MGKPKRIDIKKELENEQGPVVLEYGVPLASVPYTKIHQIPDPDFEQHLEHVAYDLVEKEKDSGKPGAFVARRLSKEGDVLEIYGWSDD